MKTLEQLAREAGMEVCLSTWFACQDELARFRAACRAEALEEAAQLIEPKNPREDWTEYAETRASCAAAIREMK